MENFEIIPIDGGVNAPDGFYADGFYASLKKSDENNQPKLDMAFLYMDNPCKVQAIFTSNKFQAAPIKYFQRYVRDKLSNFVLINTTNANALTGEKGVEDVKEILSILQKQFPQIQNPIMSSTGVIGIRLPKEKIINSFSQINLNNKNPQSHTNAAKAIMTTDRYPKEIALEINLKDGNKFRIGAMAKGAGMINPALATMLCFITTDAELPSNRIQKILQECIDCTFNSISVDGDTSTNDTIMLFSNNKSKAYDEIAFKEALKIIMNKLAMDILKDGEGTSKVVAFNIKGAKNNQEACLIAKALSNSLLVKTAIFGCDPNWGRIASTIGATKACVYEDKLSIKIGNILVYDKGEILFDTLNESKAAKIMQEDSFIIECDLGIGEGKFRAYGCDLGHTYIDINSDYRS